MSFDNSNFIKSYEHIGIRVSDRKRAISFYEKLGFIETQDLPEAHANEMCNKNGVFINLIFNGIKPENNILQDVKEKHCGITHAAFIIDNINDLQKFLQSENIKITEGPLIYSNRRKVIFIRDPDNNVLEFNELI